METIFHQNKSIYSYFKQPCTVILFDYYFLEYLLYNLIYSNNLEFTSPLLGGRHSSVVLSTPTTLRPRVCIPSTPSMFFSICNWFVMWKGRNKRKRGWDWPIFLKTSPLFGIKTYYSFSFFFMDKLDFKLTRSLLLDYYKRIIWPGIQALREEFCVCTAHIYFEHTSSERSVWEEPIRKSNKQIKEVPLLTLLRVRKVWRRCK